MSLRIGIELEMNNITGNAVMEAMESAGADCFGAICGYHGAVTAGARNDQWKMERDGSLTRGNTATMTTPGNVEVISPILVGTDGIRLLNRLLTALKDRGAEVNNQCGTHISIGVDTKARWVAMSPSKKQQVANRIIDCYNHFQPVLDAISPNCRSAAGNGYIGVARRLDNYAVEHQVEGGRGSRGGAVNLAYYITYGRIEFRQPGYTICKENIGRWLKILNAMVSMSLNENHCSHSMNLDTMPVTVDGMSDFLGLRDNVRQSIRARVLSLYRNHRGGRMKRLAVLERDTAPTGSCRYCNAHHDCPAWPDCGGSNPDGSEVA